MKTLLFIFSLFILNSAVFIGFDSRAQGVPVKTPNCAGRPKFRGVPRGSGVFFDKTCQTAFVLPPIHGSVSLSGLSQTATLSRCSQFKGAQLIASGLTDQVKALVAKLQPKTADDDDGDHFSGGTLGDQRATQDEPVGPTDEEKKAVEDLNLLLKEIYDLESTYLSLAGATAQLTYSIDMEKLIQEYQKLNPKYQIMRMPMTASKLSFSSSEGSAASLPAVLQLTVPGIGDFPVDGVPSKTSEGEAKLFGDALSGKVVLSLAGACPFYDPKTDKLAAQVSAKDFADHLSANIQYQYGLQVYRKYTAQFNLGNLAKKIVSSSSSGGFLWTSTATAIINSQDSSDWFSITTDSDDNRYYTKEDLVEDVKADLLDRVLRQITLASPDLALAALGNPGPNGASTAADGVRKSCPHIYCQAAAVVLDVLSATLGGASSAASFIKSNNVISTDTVSESKVFTYGGSSSFTPTKNSEDLE